MKKSIVLIAILFVFGCNGKSQTLSGIWIPQTVNWKDGDFSNFYFLNDTSVIIIPSTQKKIKDSIYFETEPGFNLLKGSIKQTSPNTYLISSKAIYRFIKLPAVKGNEIYVDTLHVIHQNNKITKIKINSSFYVPGDLYTKKSKERIYSIVTKMVPEIEKHSEK
jgi:hypothetical protein